MIKFNKIKKQVILIVAIILLLLEGGVLLRTLLHNKGSEINPEVSVQTELYSGKGIVYAWQEGAGYIVTAGHILDGLSAQSPCAVVFSNGEKRTAEVIYRSDFADVAFLKVEGDEVPVVTMDRKSFDALSEGDTLYRLEADEEKLVKVEGTLLSPWIYLEDFALDMMLAKLECGRGMSGCGIYDKNGYFVGILCGISHEGEAAILPLSIIESQWIMAN